MIDVPKDIRIERVKNRSFQKFGNRMLSGGDLYEQEERFFELVKSRAENTVEKWVIAPENMNFTIEEIKEQVDFQEQYFQFEIRI